MSIHDVPKPDLTGGGRGIISPWLPRYTEQMVYNLNWTDQNVWREIVNRQPVALLARDKIVTTLSSMDWRIEPIDSTKREEQRLKIKHYTKMFTENREQGTDFTDLVTHVLEDGLDLPFGSGIELIKSGDRPSGKLVDYVLLDGATLYPTNNREYPVVQKVDGDKEYIVFPKHAINRYYYSPRREINWRGWGMPPPQKIFLAIQMISKGDTYYWKLLLDTPEAGILDLMDMEKDSAESWIESFRDLMTGIDPFKVPVLYEHEKEAKYLTFSRPPAEIMFDKAISRYDSLTAGGYGLSLSSLGFNSVSSGGETLAGSIRQERNDRSRGIGLAKRKFTLFMNRMLPEDLEFQWIDPDDEQQVARGRAMLSMSTAHGQWIDKRTIAPSEARAMLIASGLPNISLSEEIPEELKKEFEELNPFNNMMQGGNSNDGRGDSPPKRQNMLTATQPPSAGGQGEIRSVSRSQFENSVRVYFSEEDLGVTTLDLTKFIDEVYDTVRFIYEEKRKTEPFFSFARHRSLDENKIFDVWQEVRSYLAQLKSDFPSICQGLLAEFEEKMIEEDLVNYITNSLYSGYVAFLSETIKYNLEI